MGRWFGVLQESETNRDWLKRCNTLYQEKRSEKSSSSKASSKHPKEQKRFREKEGPQKHGSIERETKKKPFGREWVCWGCGEKGRCLSQCRKTPKEEKEKLLQKRGFSNRRLSVLTDHQYVGKDLALVGEKVWFSYILDSGAFTTVVPKLLLKELKEAGSGEVEVSLFRSPHGLVLSESLGWRIWLPKMRLRTWSSERSHEMSQNWFARDLGCLTRRWDPGDWDRCHEELWEIFSARNFFEDWYIVQRKR